MLPALLLAAASSLAGCSSTPPRAEGPRIAFLFDGSSGDADEVTGPALAGARFAVLETGDPETIQPVNVGLPEEETAEILREVAEDGGVVAAVVAPWTAPPDGAVQALGDAGMPVVSLSWAWGPPAQGTWRSLAVDRSGEAELLIGAARSEEPGSIACLAGDTHPTSGPLGDEVAAIASEQGDPIGSAGVIDPERPATATAVAGRLSELGCRLVVWTGGAEGLERLLDAPADLPTVIGTSRIKTDRALTVALSHPLRLVSVCACADITLTRDPALQRFIHDFQTESGGAPGPLAVEAFDAGRLVLELAEGGGRTHVATALEGIETMEGLLGPYELRPDGSLRSGPVPAGSWRASGSRWLPFGAGPPGTTVPGVASALPIGALVPIVRPRTRPHRARIVPRPGGKP